MPDTPKQNWFKQHPVISSVLGFIALVSMVSAFDSGDTESYKANIYNPTSSPLPTLTATPKPTAAYKAPERQCHPSYSGCLDPNAYDYDCAGGSGNGPRYTGRVIVYGYDEFGLDRDGDGIGCE